MGLREGKVEQESQIRTRLDLFLYLSMRLRVEEGR